jgi:hypothetical protein
LFAVMLMFQQRALTMLFSTVRWHWKHLMRTPVVYNRHDFLTPRSRDSRDFDIAGSSPDGFCGPIFGKCGIVA